MFNIFTMTRLIVRPRVLLLLLLLLLLFGGVFDVHLLAQRALGWDISSISSNLKNNRNRNRNNKPSSTKKASQQQITMSPDVQLVSRREVIEKSVVGIMPSAASTAIAALSILFSTAFPQPVHGRNLPEPTTTDVSKTTGTIDALNPIVKLKQTLERLKSALVSPNDTPVLSILDDFVVNGGLPKDNDEKQFKSIFDAYSDPVSYKQKFVDQNAFLVYYTQGYDGPNRPSIESDLPVKQTLQYGARNDAWVAWDEFLSEVSYARKHPPIDDISDLLMPLSKTIAAIDTYLSQAPDADVKEATNRLLP